MNKKVLVILSLLVIMAGTSIIYAASNENTVQVDEFEFNIPDGFVENVTAEAVNEKTSSGGVEYTYCQKLFEKGLFEAISILVAEYGGYEVTDEIVSAMGGEKTTINDVDGYLGNESGIFKFSYPKEGKLVTITATDKELFDEIVIKE